MSDNSSALTVVPGSLQQRADDQGITLAESFLDCACIVMVDTSGSMSTDDSRGNRRRYDVACDELKRLQADIPGKIGVFSWSSGDEPQFCPGGVPAYQGAGTNMAGALEFLVKLGVHELADIRIIMISDGEPDSEERALRIASKFKRLDCVYVGPETNPDGRDFLRRLAAATGGQIATADRASNLAPKIEKLLLTDGRTA